MLCLYSYEKYQMHMLECTSIAHIVHTNRHVYTRMCKPLHCQISNSPCKLFALWLPYGHLYVCTARHTVQSNRAHQETSDSLYHCCFYFTLIQNKHTWRNTNRCTQAHTQSTPDPKYRQNKHKTVPGIFLVSLRERDLCR